MPKKSITRAASRGIHYTPVPTGRLFHASNKFFRGVKGPIGSGKSSLCVMELLTRAQEQRPFDGVRSTRYAIIRNTYPELKNTTMKTWMKWVPEHICPINWAPPMTAKMVQRLADGTIVDMEIIFLALDREDDVKKVMSMDLTGAWINEARYISWDIVKEIRGRVNRFPDKDMGGTTWHGVIADTNPPDEDSWWYNLAEIECPVNMQFFDQPPSLLMSDTQREGEMPVFTPNRGQGKYLAAENAENHNNGFDYWMNLIPGSDLEWIKVMIMGQYGTVMAGKPVFPEYIDDIHCPKKELEPYYGLPIILSSDFGLTPATAISQLSPQGQLRVIDELVTGLPEDELTGYPSDRYKGDMGIRRFCRELLKPYLNNKYSNLVRISVADPAGSQRAQTDEVTCLQIMAQEGIPTEMAPTNSFIARREAVSNFMTRMIGKDPGFLVSSRCRILRKGLRGGYRYRKMRTQSGDKYANTPEKNIYCVPLEAEALTPSGWKNHSDLNKYDSIYIFDLDNHKIEQGIVEAVNVFNGSHKAIVIRNSRTEFTSTLQHRNIIRTKAGLWKIIKTIDLKCGHLIQGPRHEHLPRKYSRFSREFIAWSAWVAAEGHYRDDGSIIVCQSRKANPRYVDYLNGLAVENPCIITHTGLRKNMEMATWRIRKELATLLRLLMPGKIPSANFISTMNNADRRSFLYEFVRADGNASNGSGVTFMPDKLYIVRNSDFWTQKGMTVRIRQSKREMIDALQMIATLCGFSTQIRHVKENKYNGAKAFEISILRSNEIDVDNAEREHTTIDGAWCPQTSNGTWICRQNGRVFITGNSHINDGLQYGCLHAEGGSSYGSLSFGENRSGPYGRRRDIVTPSSVGWT